MSDERDRTPTSIYVSLTCIALILLLVGCRLDRIEDKLEAVLSIQMDAAKEPPK